MALPSVSIASIVIGFISFSFTLAIVSFLQMTLFSVSGNAGHISPVYFAVESLAELQKKEICYIQWALLQAIADSLLSSGSTHFGTPS